MVNHRGPVFPSSRTLPYPFLFTKSDFLSFIISPTRPPVAEARYTAEGRLETRQATVHSTREIEFRRTTLTGTQEITRSQTARESVAGTQLPPAPVLQFPIRFDFLFPAGFNFNWFDPLAQSFNIPTEGGAFITSVDV